jgi:hypothetical protein
MRDLFLSTVGPTGDFAGVVEYDGQVAYFYLYDNKPNVKQRIISHLKINYDLSTLPQEEVAIKWDRTGRFVAIVIEGKLFGCFDAIAKSRWSGDESNDGRLTLDQPDWDI